LKRICKVCHSGNIEMIYSQGSLPVLQNRSYKAKEEARLALCADVDLALCMDCGFIFNASFQADRVVYDTSYNNNQSASQVFQDHLLEVAELLKRKGVLGQKIVEIGCGKGDFLRLLRQQGVKITGFDPTFEGYDKDVIKDYFSGKYAGELNADLIILRHVLEHIEEPFQFLTSVAEANQYQGGVYIEVPSFEWIVEHKAFWDIFPEHCNYFTNGFWGSIFSEYDHGFIFQGQYQYIFAQWGALRKVPQAPLKVKAPDLNGLKEFIYHYRHLVRARKDIIVWGAGAKGMTFVNLIDPDQQYISGLIDINKSKQGNFVGRTAHPIIGPEDIDSRAVSNVIIMNGVYKDEIRAALDGRKADLFVMGEGS